MTLALDLRGVTVRYRGAPTPAVVGLDLQIPAGERVALVGPSGAGKSTIISLANGLVLPTGGSVHTLGVDTRSLADRRHRDVRRQVGTVFQDFALVGPLRVAHNVAAGRLGEWSRLRALASLFRPREVPQIAAALERVGIADKLWERADQLSGGQQQRVAVARVAFQAPRLLLADEPVSSLDPAWSNLVLEVLVESVESAPGRTLVTSLHDADLALRHCERIVGLRDGRVHFDLPAASVSAGMLTDLYAFEETDAATSSPREGDPR